MMLNNPINFRSLVTSLVERLKDERPSYGVIHAVDGSLADIRMGQSSTLIRSVPIIGDLDSLAPGMTVSLRWERRPGEQYRPRVLAPGGGEASGTTVVGAGSFPPDNLTIENTAYGLAIKKGGVGLQHLNFVPALEGHVHKDTLQAGGWQVTEDGVIFSGQTSIHPTGQIALGLAPDIVKLDSQHATYRLWAGNPDPTQAPFSVSKTGAVHATLGDIGGWNITDTEINSDNGNAAINAATPLIRLGAAGYAVGAGFWAGKDAGVYKMRIGDPAGSKLEWDGADLVITGEIHAGSGDIGGWSIGVDELTSDAGAVGMGSGADGWRFWAGNADPSLAPFRVTNAGEVWLENAHVAVALESSNYVAGLQGWKLYNTGYAEFGDVRVRGELSTTVFKYNEISATAGTLGVYKSAGVVYAGFDVPTIGSSVTAYVKNKTGGASALALNDIVRIKVFADSIKDSWFTVTNVGTNFGDYTGYTLRLESGSESWRVEAGTAIVDCGQSGDGFITLTADGAIGASPNISLATHAGAPWSTYTDIMRIGKLDGYGSLTGYGVAIGSPTSANALYYANGTLTIKGEGSGVTNIDGGHIQTNTITATQIAANTITAAQIAAGTITGDRLVANTLTATQIAANAVTASELAANAVEATHIKAGAVTADKLSVTSLSAINTSTGTLLINTGGYIRLNGGYILDYTTSGATISWQEVASSNKIYGYLEAAYSGGVNQFLRLRNETATAGYSVYTQLMSQRRSDANRYASVTAYYNYSSDLSYAAIHAQVGTALSSEINVQQGEANILLDDTGRLLHIYNGSYHSYIGMANTSWLHYTSGSGAHYFYGDVAIQSGLSLGTGGKMANGEFGYNGNLRPYRNSSYYTAYTYVPLASPIVVQAPWATKTGASTGATLTFTLTGVPANVKAVSVRIGVKGNVTGQWLFFGPASGTYMCGAFNHVNDSNTESDAAGGILNTNGTNVVYQSWDAKGGTISWFMHVFGYWI